jgi:type I restriction enzyme, S subunit
MIQNEKLALGKIFNIARGGSPRPIQNFITNDKDGIPWIMIGDASEGSKYISDTKKRIIKEGIKSSRRVNPGDFLLTNSMSFGHPYIMKISGCIHDGWLVLSPKRDDIDQDYFYYLLGSNTVYEEFSRRASGTTVKNLNIDLVSGVTVSFPPLEEQRRIAAILDKADEVRRKRQQAIALTEELLRSLFLDMFGDPVTNPKGWEVVKLGIVTDSKLGKMLSESARKGISPVKYLGNTHVRWRSFNLEELPEMDFSDTELQKLDLRYGDLIVCEGGEVGRCAIWRNELENISFQKALHRIRCQTTKVIPEYLQEYFVFMAKRGGLVSSTSSATIAHLTGVRLKQLPLPLPLISEQRSFQKIYKMYEQLMFKYNRDYKEIEILFNSLLQKAFRGEL